MRSRNIVCRSGVVLLISSLLLSGCTSSKFDLQAHYLPPGMETRIVLYRERVFDDYGRPMFRGRTDERPTRKGETYIAVYYREDVPVLSYDILVAGPSEKDLRKAYETIDRWTEKGAEIGLGLETCQEYSNVRGSGCHEDPYGLEETRGEPETLGEALEQRNEGIREAGPGEVLGSVMAEGVVKTMGVVVGGLIGALLGSAKAGSNRLFVYKSEAIILSTRYEYDGMKRLSGMRIYTPERGYLFERARVEFSYAEDGDEPSRMEVVPVSAAPPPPEQE